MTELNNLQGKTVGVIYSFEGEEAPGFMHYHFWESDIISKWLVAIQNLRCRPYILDVRTFVEKSFAGTMPHLDFVLNLNCGGCELSPMALVPSICAFFNIPCVPCDAVSILTGENKLVSNLVATATGLCVPHNLSPKEDEGIFRPINLGSSVGIKRGPLSGDEPRGLYQEFITGFDITTPIVYNPITHKMCLMPTVLYIPDENNAEWYLAESYKESRSGFTREAILSISDELKNKYLEFVENISINTYCRIDARIKCSNVSELKNLLKEPLNLEDVYFVEVNPMPTVWINNALSHSLSKIDKESDLYPYVACIKDMLGDADIYTFLLSLSMLSIYNQVQK